MWHHAMALTDLADGALHDVQVDERDLCLAVVDGEPRAIANICPHRGAALSDGLLRDGCVTCPAHLWRFSLVDGIKQGDPRVRVATFPTRVIDGAVEVDLPPRARERSLREVLLAHARGDGRGDT